VGFHESLAHELLTEEDVDGVKTTLVCPYVVDTGMFDGCRIRSVYNVFPYAHEGCIYLIKKNNNNTVIVFKISFLFEYFKNVIYFYDTKLNFQQSLFIPVFSLT